MKYELTLRGEVSHFEFGDSIPVVLKTGDKTYMGCLECHEDYYVFSSSTEEDVVENEDDYDEESDSLEAEIFRFTCTLFPTENSIPLPENVATPAKEVVSPEPKTEPEEPYARFRRFCYFHSPREARETNQKLGLVDYPYLAPEKIEAPPYNEGVIRCERMGRRTAFCIVGYAGQQYIIFARDQDIPEGLTYWIVKPERSVPTRRDGYQLWEAEVRVVALTKEAPTSEIIDRIMGMLPPSPCKRDWARNRVFACDCAKISRPAVKDPSILRYNEIHRNDPVCEVLEHTSDEDQWWD